MAALTAIDRQLKYQEIMSLDDPMLNDENNPGVEQELESCTGFFINAIPVAAGKTQKLSRGDTVRMWYRRFVKGKASEHDSWKDKMPKVG